MSKQNPDTILNEVRDILSDLLNDTTDDKYMRARLALSLKLIDTAIAANNAGKNVCDRIKPAVAQHKVNKTKGN